MKLDVQFIEFYIMKKYNQKMEDFFGVNKSVVSKWRNKKFPDSRMHEFVYKEGTSDIYKLFKELYK